MPAPSRVMICQRLGLNARVCHQDTALRADGLRQRPLKEMKAARDAALDAWISTPASEKETIGQRMLRPAERLGAALEGRPDDDELREQLGRIDDLPHIERLRGVKARLQEERDLLVRWLASAGLDEETGLPWDYLAGYRWLPDPVLGKVPGSWNSPAGGHSPKHRRRQHAWPGSCGRMPNPMPWRSAS